MKKPDNFEQAQEVAKKLGLGVVEVVRAFKVPVPEGANYTLELVRAMESENFHCMNWVYNNALDDDVRAEALKARKKYCRKILARAVENGNFRSINWVYNNALDDDVKAEALEATNKYCREKLARAVYEENIDDIRWVYNNALDGSDIKAEALRNIVLLTE